MRCCWVLEDGTRCPFEAVAHCVYCEKHMEELLGSRGPYVSVPCAFESFSDKGCVHFENGERCKMEAATGSLYCAGHGPDR